MNRLLFFGEIPPRSIHGVAISNRVNLDMLAESFAIDVVEEHIDLMEHGRFSLNKYFAFLRYCKQVFLFAIMHKYTHYYATFSLSFVGCFKSSIPIIIFKLFNPKAKVIVHIHRGDFLAFYQRKFLHRIASRIIFGAAERVVFLSELFVHKALPFSNKFTVLPNTVHVKLPDQAERTNKRFLFLSNYIFEKGLLEFLEAVNLLSEHQISARCFGQFTSEEIKEKVQKLLSPNIQIYGFIDNEAVKYHELASAHCLVLPSHNEGQPLVLLEAMATGTLIIASKVGAIPDMLGEEYPFIIEPKSVQELQNAMLKMLELNSEEKTYWSNYLLQRFNLNFSKTRHKELLFEIFN